MTAMKLPTIAALIPTTVFGVSACLLSLYAPTCNAEETLLKTEKDKVSYSIGMNVGQDFRQQKLDIHPNLFIKGLSDAISGKKMLLTEDQAKKILLAFQQKLFQEHEKERALLGEKNLKKGEAFLTQNKQNKDVVTLSSGLQYRVLSEGTGALPTLADSVSTHYRGTFIDGTEFDSSYKRGEPVTFPLQGVIPGWTEALQQMKTGSKWQLFIPANLAYGEHGSGKAIGPNETLVFEIELLKIINQEEHNEEG